MRAGMAGDEHTAGERLGAALSPGPAAGFRVWTMLAGVVDQVRELTVGPDARPTRLVYLDDDGQPADLTSMAAHVAEALDWGARFVCAYMARDQANTRVIYRELTADPMLWARTTNVLFNLAVQAACTARAPAALRGDRNHVRLNMGDPALFKLIRDPGGDGEETP